MDQYFNMDQYFLVLDRIANALERQTQQAFTWFQQQIAWHDEGVARQHQQRQQNDERYNAEMAELRKHNDDLLERLNTAVQQNAQVLALYQSNQEKQERLD